MAHNDAMTTVQERPGSSSAVSNAESPGDEPGLSRRNHWVNHVARHAHERPDHAALRFAGSSTTYAELDARTARLADALARRGVSQGDRVALLTTNRPEFVEAMLATTRLGAIAVPVNFRLSVGEVRYVLADSGAVVVLTEDALLPLVTGARTELPDLRTVVLISESAAEDGTERYADLLAERGARHTPPDVHEDAPALIMYTSGTTGHPKGAVLTHLNLLSQSHTVLASWRVPGADTVNLCAAPMFHIAAVGCIAPLLLSGGTTVIHPTGGFDAAGLLDALETERVTTLFLVPAQWQVVCADPSVPTRDLRLEVISWGAAPASDTVLRRMSEVFPDARNVAVFGQTEMSPITCSLDGADALRKLGSVGKPIDAVSVRVVDEDLRDVPAGEVGEIVYRGPNLMLGYWNNPEATAAAFRGGWFHSGDPRPPRRGRFRLRRRPAQGHDHLRRGEHLLQRGGERRRRPSRSRRGRGDRPPRRAVRRGAAGGPRREPAGGAVGRRAADLALRAARPLQAPRPRRRGRRAAAQRRRQGGQGGTACGPRPGLGSEVVTTTAEKAAQLRALHLDPELLLVVNVWDAITAKVVAETPGTTALATASHSIAASHGYPDGEQIPLDLMIAAVGRIATATDLPVTADLEAGYGDAGATISRAIDVGIVGANLEDQVKPLPEAVAAVEAAVAAGERAGVPFALNARTDAFLRAGDKDPAAVLADAIERGRAYLDAGATSFFVPGKLDEPTVTQLVEALGPQRVNLIGVPGSLSLATCQQLGVARVSYGPWSQNVALTALAKLTEDVLAGGELPEGTRKLN